VDLVSTILVDTFNNLLNLATNPLSFLSGMIRSFETNPRTFFQFILFWLFLIRASEMNPFKFMGAYFLVCVAILLSFGVGYDLMFFLKPHLGAWSLLGFIFPYVIILSFFKLPKKLETIREESCRLESENLEENEVVNLRREFKNKLSENDPAFVRAMLKESNWEWNLKWMEYEFETALDRDRARTRKRLIEWYQSALVSLVPHHKNSK
jgi:hypothetical protein